MKRLTHVDEQGGVTMVDVGEKPVSRREAVAVAHVRMQRETLDLIERVALPKGDVLTTARIAGILAAKRTSDVVPLTHPLPIDVVTIDFDVSTQTSEIIVRATVACSARTGVEIEAMHAVMIAALTIYDMCKAVDRGMTIELVQLLRKSGGKSGTYERK